MSLTKTYSDRIAKLKQKYDKLKKGREKLLTLLDEVEISESVYNSNAIENSTLSLSDTERVLIDLELSRNTSIREVFEAKNLARVIEHLNKKEALVPLSLDMILFLHNILLTAIRDDWAGRFRNDNEYVKVGKHLAPRPEDVQVLMQDLVQKYNNQAIIPKHPVSRIAKFHLDFETIHPFCDGNGRVGRVLINYQLVQLDFPPVIIRDSSKKTYYKSFDDYRVAGSTQNLEKVIALALIESFHKRIAYLDGQKIIKLSDYIKNNNLSAANVTNMAKVQTIPAFRDKGVWMIGVGQDFEQQK
jgi:Fic family protein